MSIFFFFFNAAISANRRADLQQIEKVRFWFLNSFAGNRKVQKGHLRFGLSFTKRNMAAKRICLSRNEAVWFWPDNLSAKRWKLAEIFRCILCEYKDGDARLTTLPWGNINRLVLFDFAAMAELFLQWTHTLVTRVCTLFPAETYTYGVTQKCWLLASFKMPKSA